jgi:hypothetical protein
MATSWNYTTEPHGPHPDYRHAGPAAEPVRAYGCVRCQKEHREGLDPEYEPHLMFQSKHGWYLRRAEVGRSSPG